MSDAVRRLRRHVPQGAGMGLRHELWHGILDHADRLDAVELILDDYLHMTPREAARALRPIQEAVPVIAHGVRLSVASAQGIDRAYVESVARLLDALGVELYTEHLSFRRAGDDELGQFVPVPFTERWADRVAANVREVQAITGRTLALENITYLLGHPGVGLGEWAFIGRVLEGADCGLLLDVTNLLINGANLAYTPDDVLDAIPLERVVYAHIAGGHQAAPFHIDSHGHPIADADLELLRQLRRRAPGLGLALLERDKNYPPLDALLGEVERIREALAAGAREEGQRLDEPLAVMASLTPAPAQPDGTPPDPDAIDPEALQRTIARTLIRPDALRGLRRDGALPDDAPPDPDGQARAWMLSFPDDRYGAFAQVLSFKRREKFDTLLPGLFRALQEAERLKPLLRGFFRDQPDQGRACAEDACAFAAYVLERDDLPDFVRALARHERAVVELRAQPWRPWRVWGQRRALELDWDPLELDRFGRGDPAPAPLPRPVRARYTRKRRGVWVESR